MDIVRRGASKVLAGLAVALAAALAGPAGAGATALGGLTAQGCLSTAALAPCTTLEGQLGNAQAVVVSPDGTSAYATGYTKGTLVTLGRAAGGALTPRTCFSDVAVTGCTVLAGRLGGAVDVVVSPDGTSVYALGFDPGTLLSFTRAADGTLTPQGCFSSTAVSGCGTALAGRLASAGALAVSPDGKSVYVGAAGFVLSLVRAADGTLTPQGCLSSDPTPGCTTVSGLGIPSAAAVSPDGTSVYVTTGSAGGVFSFARAGDGTLTTQGCTTNAALAGCTTLAGQLDATQDVAVSPDGKNVYVTATLASDTVVTFARGASGALTAQGCLSNAALAGCTTLPGQLDGAGAVAVAGDGASVYATANQSNTVVTLTRDASGTLTPADCVSTADRSGCTTVPGRLGFANGVTVAPDGLNVYATAGNSSALSTFARELPPTCSPSSSTGAAGAEQTLLLDCREPNGDPLTLAIASGPAHGTLGAIAQAGRVVSYTPVPGFSGADAVTVTATADGKTSAPATVSITVTPGPPGTTPPGSTPPGTTPPGTEPPVFKLSLRLLSRKLTVRRGRTLTVAYTAGVAGTAKLTVLKGKAVKATATKRLVKPGRGSVTLAGRTTKRLKPGRYSVTLRFTPAAKGAKAVTVSAPLTVKR